MKIVQESNEVLTNDFNINIVDKDSQNNQILHLDALLNTTLQHWSEIWCFVLWAVRHYRLRNSN